MIPDRSSVEAAQTKVSKAKENLDNVRNNIIEKYGDSIRDLLVIIFDIAPVFPEGTVPANIISGLSSDIAFLDGKNLAGLINDINKTAVKSVNAQQVLINAYQELVYVSAQAIETQELESLRSVLSPIADQYDEINNQIRDIQTQLSCILSA